MPIALQSSEKPPESRRLAGKGAEKPPFNQEAP
jgi:hypothetical protein